MFVRILLSSCVCYSPCLAGQLSWVWQAMLSAFERSLLHTHRSKFTQFLIFFLCLHNPEQCCRSFTSVLLGHLRDNRQAPITRAACAAYLASFLARSAFAAESLVVDVLSKLASSCREYARTVQLPRSASSLGMVTAGGGGTGGGSGGGNGVAEAVTPKEQRHQVFYASMQAVLYILCYHLEPLMRGQPQHPGSTPEHAAAVSQLVREVVLPLLEHPLAPLTVLLPSVSLEFINQIQALQLVGECSRLLQAVAARAMAGGPGGVAGDQQQQQLVQRVGRPLEMFFPFDPYLLHRSSKYLQLEQSFVTWRGGHPTAAVLGEGGESSEEEEEGAGEGEPGSALSEGREGGAGSSGEESDSDTSSPPSEEEGDAAAGAGGAVRGGMNGHHRHHLGLPPVAGSGKGRGQLPIGVAALSRNFERMSGASPDLMGTSLVPSHYMDGSLGSGLGYPGETPPFGSSPMVLGGMGMSPVAGGGMGGSPMAMSYAADDGMFMQHQVLPAQH